MSSKPKVVRYVMLLITLNTICVAHAFVPPIGIPDPGFGITDTRPSRPESWSMPRPGYYFVNEQTGTDSNNPYGSPAKPRRSIPSSLPAGTYVEVHGTYSRIIGGATEIKGKGNNKPWVANQSGPVWIVGQDPSRKPDFVTKVIVSGSYIYFDNVRIFKTGTLQVGSSTPGSPADHIVLRNSEALGNKNRQSSAIIGVVGSATHPVSDVVIYNNKVHDNGDVAAKYDQDADLVAAVNHTSRVWVLDNTLYNASGVGFFAGGAYRGSDNCHHIYAGRNKISNTRQAGLAVKYASDVIFSQNVVHDIVDTRPLFSESSSPGKGVGFQYEPQRLWILYNTIYNASYGVYGGSTNSGTWHIYVIGNVIHNIHRPSDVSYRDNAWAEAGIMIQGGSHRYIVNNTIYNADAGINGPSVGTRYYMKNNIVAKITESQGNHIFIEDGDSASRSMLSHCVLFQNGSNARIRWGADSNSGIFGSRGVSGSESGCTQADPLFMDVSRADFRTKPNSPSIDNGAASEVYSAFESLYGISIARDRSGAPRPSGRDWDIGAFETIQ